MAKKSNELFVCRAVASEIAEVSTAQLRGWNQRDQAPKLENGEERKAGSWRGYSKLDILQLRLMGKLVAVGMPVEDASTMSAGFLKDVRGLDDFDDIVKALDGAVFAIWVEKKDWLIGRFEAQVVKNAVPECFRVLDVGRCARNVRAAFDAPERVLSRAAQLWLENPPE